MSIKKILLISIVFSTILFTKINSHAQFQTIYETSKKTPISTDTYLTELKKFTTDGWLNINIIETKTNLPNIKLNTIYNDESINKPTSTSELADLNNAIAAINGSFYVKLPDRGQVSPVGTFISSGEILSADNSLNHEKDTIANFSIDNNNNPKIDFFKTEMKIISPNGNSKDVIRYNKPYYYHEELCIIDKKMSSTTIGTKDQTKELVEMIVSNNKVTAIRTNNDSEPIPKNGYVVLGRKSYKDFILNNFSIGDEVIFDIKTNIDLTQLNTSHTGGSIILNDGKIPVNFSHDSSNSSRNPRSAIGISKDSKKLYLVTVDGRQNSSVGMTMNELSNFMKKTGSHKAINFDGGGSTTLVARRLGNDKVSVINSFSDSTERKVANAFALFSTAKIGKLNKLILVPSQDKLFINSSLNLTLKGLDSNYNPVKIDPNKIIWSVNGISGKFDKNKFTSLSTGSGTISAKYNNINVSINIESLEEPTKINFENEYYYSKINENVNLKIIGTTKEGFSYPVTNKNIIYETDNNIGSIEKNVFTGKSFGKAYIKATLNNKSDYSYIEVNQKNSSPKQNIENTFSIKKEITPKYSKTPYDIETKMNIYFQNKRPDTIFKKLFQKKLTSANNNPKNLTVLFDTDKFDILFNNSIQSKTEDYFSSLLSNTQLIFLDNKKNSLRTNDKNQWNWFLEKLEEYNGDNQIIFLQNNPDNFSDMLELKLFKDVLTKKYLNSKQNIWVIYGNKNNESLIHNGINYLGIKYIDDYNIVKNNLENIDSTTLNICKEDLSYEYNKLNLNDINNKDYINFLKEFNIIKGYSDGSFKLEENITRAELTALIVRMSDIKSDSSNQELKYSDVKTTHWAYEYIKTASENNLISGYSDKSFRPNLYITNAEYLKIIINLLGFTKTDGEWPTNVISKSNELSILNDLNIKANDYAKRGNIFKSIYNSLDIKINNK